MKYKSLTEIANKYGVSRRAVEAWRQRNDWPARQEDGSINARAVEKFLRRNSLGPHNQRRRSGDISDALREATTRKLFEQSENERIRKERQLVEQAVERGVVLRASDVLREYSRKVATVMVLHDAFAEAMDRALPEDFPNRAEAMEIARRLPQQTYEAMRAIR